jgi:dephospho-CoA kinase
MLNVALTGNIASGKSTVARLFASWGATVIDADRIVHQLERPGTQVFRAIVERFGPGVLAVDGTLDRAALRQLVFGQPAERAALNAIVHPAVGAERTRELEAARRRGDRIVISDIPLLFETMDPRGFDAVVLVDAPVDLRRARIMQSRGLDRAAADAMIASQMPSEAKRSLSTYVIDNSGDLEALELRARQVWESLQEYEKRE